MLAWRCHWYALLPSSTEWCTAGQLWWWTFYYTSSLFSTTVDIFCFSFLAHFGIKSTQGWNWLSILSEVKVKLLSRVLLFATPWTVVYQAPLSMGLSRQEYWSGLSFPAPGESTRPKDWTHIADRFFMSLFGNPKMSITSWLVSFTCILFIFSLWAYVCVCFALIMLHSFG